MSASDYLDDWLASGKRKKEAADLKKLSVINDRWDRASHQEVVEQLPKFKAARDVLGEFAPESGCSLFEDTFYSLIKAMPDQVRRGEMRPSHLINHMVTGIAIDLDEYERIHRYCVADEIAAGVAAVSMEPKLEVILDKLKAERSKLEKMAEDLQQYQQLEADLEELEALMREKQEGEQAGEPSPQDNKALIEEQMQRLEAQMRATAEEIDEGFEATESEIIAALQEGMKGAADAAGLQETACSMWGLDPGGLKQMPAEERMALAEKLDSEKFRRVAQLFGSMKNYAMSEQKRKVTHIPEEVVNIEQGNDLKRVLDTERARLSHPVLKPIAIMKLAGRRMPQLRLEGVEKVAKGSIIYCEDGSGSMGGGREIWAKAVGLCLLKIAQTQGRNFYGIHFGGTGEIYEFDFSEGPTGDVSTSYSGYQKAYYEPLTLPYIQGVIHFAELFFGGGTDFITPLSRAMELQVEEYEQKKRVSGDIVFVTDGQCGVSDKWLEDFKEKQAELGFKVWGVVIGGSPADEPLHTICDGKVLTIKDLTDGVDLQNAFRNI